MLSTDLILSVLKDLNLLKKHIKNQEANSILRVDITQSNRPHLHRAYLVTVPEYLSQAVYVSVFQSVAKLQTIKVFEASFFAILYSEWLFIGSPAFDQDLQFWPTDTYSTSLERSNQGMQKIKSVIVFLWSFITTLEYLFMKWGTNHTVNFGSEMV